MRAINVQPRVRVKLGLPQAVVVIVVVIQRDICRGDVCAVVKRHSLVEGNALIDLQDGVALNLFQSAIEAHPFVP